jgi:hypothetical protein
MKTIVALAAGLLALAGAVQADTPAKPSKAQQCFWAHNADGFAAANDHVVNIRVGVRDVYQFEMMGACPDIDWANRIALVTRGSNFICTGMDADIVTHTSIGPQRCPVRSLRKLSPQEVAALGKGAKP